MNPCEFSGDFYFERYTLTLLLLLLLLFQFFYFLTSIRINVL